MKAKGFILIAADTSRTRAYLAALFNNEFKPNWVLLLGKPDVTARRGNLRENDTFPLVVDPNWEDSVFDPIIDLSEWLDEEEVAYSQISSNEINSSECLECLNTRFERLVIFSGYGGSILREKILGLGKDFLHVHGGYLPDYRGSTTNYFSTLSEGYIGASAIFLEKQIDHGVIVARRKFVLPNSIVHLDHFYDSAARARVLIEALDLLLGFDFQKGLVQEEDQGEVYYIVHPLLKHLAILKAENI